MCVNHVCKVQFARRVIGFGCDTEVKVPNPHRKLLVDFSVLPEEKSRIKHNQEIGQYLTFNHTITLEKHPVDHNENLDVANLMTEFILEAQSKGHNYLLL